MYHLCFTLINVYLYSSLSVYSHTCGSKLPCVFLGHHVVFSLAGLDKPQKKSGFCWWVGLCIYTHRYSYTYVYIYTQICSNMCVYIYDYIWVVFSYCEVYWQICKYNIYIYIEKWYKIMIHGRIYLWIV